MTRFMLPILAGLMMISACGEEKASDDAAPAPAGDTAAPASDARPSAGTSRPGGLEPIDPATGTLSLEAEGPHPGNWTFQDVNGSVSEQAGGGETTMTLQLEAHNEPVHLRLRLTSADGDVRPGRYAVGGTDRSLDATYENAGVYYKSIGKASGHVELASVSDDRAKGAYDLTLETLAEPASVARVRGTFDMRVQR